MWGDLHKNNAIRWIVYEKPVWKQNGSGIIKEHITRMNFIQFYISTQFVFLHVVLGEMAEMELKIGIFKFSAILSPNILGWLYLYLFLTNRRYLFGGKLQSWWKGVQIRCWFRQSTKNCPGSQIHTSDFSSRCLKLLW